MVPSFPPINPEPVCRPSWDSPHVPFRGLLYRNHGLPATGPPTGQVRYAFPSSETHGGSPATVRQPEFFWDAPEVVDCPHANSSISRVRRPRLQHGVRPVDR